jgi:uncharacterized membrane protein YjjB (DUF3815 family)
VLVVYVAFIGEQLGIFLLGGYFGRFLSAVLMTLVAYTADVATGAPPSQVLFLPGFWLLVPGVLAVAGLAELLGNDLSAALVDISTTAFTVLAIATGVLVGVPLARIARGTVLQTSSSQSREYA